APRPRRSRPPAVARRRSGRRDRGVRLALADGGRDDVPDVVRRLDPPTDRARKLRARLLKSVRDVSLRYDMLAPGDKIMVCVSGGKDSATLLHLLMHLRNKLSKIGTDFEVIAVHLNQVQPGYDNAVLVEWLDSLRVPYRVVTEDTYSIVTEKTPEGKAYCSLCSRLRRGILYTVAHELDCNKIALGHHGDDAMETMLLNMVHGGTLKGMPARYHSATRDVHVLRPMIACLERDVADFAAEMDFPILPCNLCGSQEDLHRGKAKMLFDALVSDIAKCTNARFSRIATQEAIRSDRRP
ncbi:hypothetical protein ACHAWF_017993, partial [Thalassiosira exigua]